MECSWRSSEASEAGNSVLLCAQIDSAERKRLERLLEQHTDASVTTAPRDEILTAMSYASNIGPNIIVIEPGDQELLCAIRTRNICVCGVGGPRGVFDFSENCSPLPNGSLDSRVRRGLSDTTVISSHSTMPLPCPLPPIPPSRAQPEESPIVYMYKVIARHLSVDNTEQLCVTVSSSTTMSGLKRHIEQAYFRMYKRDVIVQQLQTEEDFDLGCDAAL